MAFLILFAAPFAGGAAEAEQSTTASGVGRRRPADDDAGQWHEGQ